MSLQMEQLMRAMGHEIPQTRRVLELNPEHSVVRRLMSMAEAGDGRVDDFVSVLYDQALILDGATLANPGQFARKLANIMNLALEEKTK